MAWAYRPVAKQWNVPEQSECHCTGRVLDGSLLIAGRASRQRRGAEASGLVLGNGPWWRRMGNNAYYVHETAIVDEGATIGDGTKVWHFAHVMPGATIGDRCVIGQGCFVGNVTIGNNVRIQNNVSVYDRVTLEDDVFCGPSCVFTNVVNPRAAVSRKDEYAPTVVRRGASIGANATIVCGATLGEYAFVAAGAVVRGDVEPYALVAGVPARRIGWMCECGVRLPDDPGRATCSACERSYEIGADRCVRA